MDESENAENIRTEYTAISAKLNQLPSFRFALIGFYIAAVGVIASRESYDIWIFILLIGLTIPLWLIDLRTRGLLDNIGNRGKQIEKDWGYEGWIGQMGKESSPIDTETDSSSEGVPDFARLFFWNIRLPRFVTHSFGFDLLFSGVLVYSVIQLLMLIFPK